MPKPFLSKRRNNFFQNAETISFKTPKPFLSKRRNNFFQNAENKLTLFTSYEKILKDLFIIYDLPAWNLNLRTTVAVRTAPTHHFVDTSIAAAALGINPADLLNDMKSFGYFFEDFAVRDLSVYAESIGGILKHYRDSSGQEVDAVVELENGEYCAVEIKITSEKNVTEGIASLNDFEQKIKTNGLKEPRFKMLLTSHGACYKKDGVFIVPITCLKD